VYSGEGTLVLSSSAAARMASLAQSIQKLSLGMKLDGVGGVSTPLSVTVVVVAAGGAALMTAVQRMRMHVA
jgi:hypothetical protein